jgi:hypothetical protein
MKNDKNELELEFQSYSNLFLFAKVLNTFNPDMDDLSLALKSASTITLVSLFIRAPDLGFLKPLYSKARFFGLDPARKIRDTNGRSL